MKFTSSVLFVKNIQVSKKFYTEILNLKIEQDFGTNVGFTCGIAIWQIDKDHPIRKNLNTSGSSNRTELYFECDDITSYDEKLANGNVKFLHRIHEEAWGQMTIRLLDPDNHLIELGESMHSFVGRLNSQGMSSQQIHEKTGIPLPYVEKLMR